MHVTVLRAARRGKQKRVAPTRVLAVTATAGVRGAITLAGILTLPTELPNGAPFPARDVAIFLAMGVILLSLLFATVALPILTRGLASLPGASENASAAAKRVSEATARTAAAEAAVRGIENMLTETAANAEESVARAEAAMHLLAAYRRRLEYGDPHEDETDPQRVALAERELHLRALQAEREELLRLRKERGIDDDVHRVLLREIDLVEASLSRASAH
jgi:monovalent cation/hydrogen antiporter